MAQHFALGLDFGTEAGRALLVDVASGQEAATAVYPYADGGIDQTLPGDDIPLPPEWALQNPQDYLETLFQAIPKVLQEAGVSGEQVIGIGIDFTSCTLLPTTSDGTPLCFIPQYRREPHAWVKLWKHHGAQPQTVRINQVAQDRQEPFLARYGGKIGVEWFFPKVLQILEEAPHIYHTAGRIVEAADWVVWQLTGDEVRSACHAGYKALWTKQEGFPSREFLGALHPELADVVATKMSPNVHAPGLRAGGLTCGMAEKTGLPAGTPVAVATIDAHAAVPGAGVVDEGKMVMVMGTSTCHMLMSREEVLVEGMAGVVGDGILPGFYGYEAGQAAVGDIFGWFTDQAVPESYHQDSRRQGLDLHQYLTRKAAELRPGESGLLALDWWNGNRSVLMDAELSGVILGLTLNTRPEEIYRALIEATAFGTRQILESCGEQGVTITQLCACGGLASKNPILMQIYADITGREISISASEQSSALGAAILGAVASGSGRGGFNSPVEAATRMARLRPERYQPDSARSHIYDRLFVEYQTLHDYFGRGQNEIMKRLKGIRDQTHADRA